MAQLLSNQPGCPLGGICPILMPLDKLWPNWHRLDVDPKILDETQNNLVLRDPLISGKQTHRKRKKTTDKSVTLVAFKLPSERMELYDITLAI